MTIDPVCLVGYLESWLHEVDFSLLDIEDLVDLGDEVGQRLYHQCLRAFGLGVVGHLHTHHHLLYCAHPSSHTIGQINPGRAKDT
jgi:hypothetical protein